MHVRQPKFIALIDKYSCLYFATHKLIKEHSQTLDSLANLNPDSHD
jgi:hypothetical protein